MNRVEFVAEGLRNALYMAYEVWWALVLGFAISAVVQAWFSREKIESGMSGRGLAPVLRATVWGAASSSRSYAAIAIAKTLFQKGASASSALAFQFASTTLVWELGLLLWLLMGWRFAAAEFLGGFVLIIMMWAMLRLFVSRNAEARAREHAVLAATGHQHHSSSSAQTWRERVGSSQAWSDVAHNFRGDWQMLWKEITAGFVIAGFVSLAPVDLLHELFLVDSDSAWRELQNVLVGPLIAIVTFVRSVGNIPLAAVLWSGGISFAGVLSFIFADLLVVPILVAYRKYYGTAFTVRISLLMLTTMVLASLAVSAIFDSAGLIPTERPAVHEMFAGVHLDYKLALNIVGTVAFVALMYLTIQRGAKDPVHH